MAKITLKGNPVHTNGDIPKTGSKLHDFTLVDKDLKEHSLSDFKGKKKVIYTAPSLDTSVCLLSTKKLNDLAKKHKDTVFMVITTDLPFAQKRICGLEHIDNLVVLSLVRSKKCAEDMGILIVDGPLEGLIARSLFVVNEDNVVKHVELVSEITHEPNFDTI